MKIPALSKRVAVMANFAMLFYSTIRRRVQAVTPDGQVLDLEHTGRQGVAGGYPSLNGDAYVWTSQLGSGATGAGSKFLADDYTWKAGGGGGGTLDHAALTSNLAWSTSGHTGTASRIAGFDGAGAASVYTAAGVLDLLLTTRGDMPLRGAGTTARLPVGAANYLLLSDGTDPAWASPASVRTALSLVVGTNVQAWDADLDTFAALASDGVLIRSTTWQIATLTAPLQRSGATLSVAAATTSAAGVVELANDGEETAGLAVQASDSRLAAAPSLWSVWGHVQPRGTISPPSYDGRGALSAQGIHSASVAEPNFPAFRLGDTSANACRFTIVGAFRLDEGSWRIDYFFKLGSDISATQTCWIGMFNGTTLDSADPTTAHRAGLRYVAGTDTNWMLGTKDGTTPNNVDSGVAVTASYYYVVRLRLTTTTYTAQIGRGVTLAAAILDFASFTPVANNSNLPGSTTDLQIISSCYRASVATANRSIISGPMLWRCDL